MKYWSRAIALVYLAFMAGVLYAMVGDELPARAAGHWSALDSLRAAIFVVLGPFIFGLLAGIEHGKERGE